MTEIKKRKSKNEELARIKHSKRLEELAIKGDEEARIEEDKRYKTDPPKFAVSTKEPELDIGKRLQHARENKGLTQGQLAELTVRADKEGKGISRAVISLYESGKNRPGLKEIRLVCECLRVTPSYLVYGQNDPFEGRTEYERFFGMGRTDAEYYANMLYLFKKLHKHHSEAIMKIMQDLLSLWEKGFDSKMREEAFPKFLEMADQLRSELAERDKK